MGNVGSRVDDSGTLFLKDQNRRECFPGVGCCTFKFVDYSRCSCDRVRHNHQLPA